MRSVSFTEFRKNSSAYFNEVEKGETLRITRHGHVIAEIIPATDVEGPPSWKRPGLRLAVRGAALSDVILEERRREP